MHRYARGTSHGHPERAQTANDEISREGAAVHGAVLFPLKSIEYTFLQAKACIRLTCDVSAEVEGWPDGKAYGVPGTLQNVGEQVVMHKIRLQANTCILEEV